MGVIESISGWFTPVCNDCGVHLCWDISQIDYDESKNFWDNWTCRTCDPTYWIDYLAEQRAERHRVNPPRPPFP